MSESSGAGPSGLQPPVSPGERRRAYKRQRGIDREILKEAEDDARLEESVMATEFIDKEALMMKNRRDNVNLEMGMSASREDIQLKKLGLKVGSVLDRLKIAKESLEKSSAKKIKVIEDEYTRDMDTFEQQLTAIDDEEQNKQDGHRLMRRHHQTLHARDLHQEEEDLVSRIQRGQDKDSEEDEGEEDEDALD